MKLHLPQALRKALLAILIPSAVSSVSFAEITPIIYQDHEDTLSFNDGKTWFSFESTSAAREEPITLLSFENNASIEFNNNTESPLKIAPSSYNGSNLQVKFLSNNGDISFSNNSDRAIDGGAMGLYFTNNLEEIRFQSNAITDGNGGAIFGRSGSKITFTNNQLVSFDNNKTITTKDNISAYGGAIYTYGSVAFDGNKQVVFTNNTANNAGGGLWASHLDISNTTEKVLFSNNRVTTARDDNSDYQGSGGAIVWHYNNGSAFNIANNKEVVFENNTAYKSGGAIHLNTSTSSSTVFKNNTSLTFKNNTAETGNGGAINNRDNNQVTFQENGTILFENNTAKTSGGAIYSSFSFNGNQEVTFSGNSSEESGGAIKAAGASSIANNDTVEFRGNYVKHYDEEGTTLTGAVLNGLDVTGYKLTLSTKASGGSITFYDTLQAVQTVNLNSYEDSDGNTVTGTGAITLSGKYAEEDLTNIFNTLGLDTTGDGFQDCLTKSLTSTITSGTNVTLHGGSLNVTDGAILNIQKRNDIDEGSYIAKAGSLTEISSGAMNIDGKVTLEGDGETYANLNISNGSMTTGKDFTSAGYTKIYEGSLNIGKDVILKDGGWIELQEDSSVTATGKFTVKGDSALEITRANTQVTAQSIVFEKDSYLDHYHSNASVTLTAPSVTMTGSNIMLTSGDSADQYDLTVDGNLSLTDCTINLVGGSDNDFNIFQGIDITRTLTVSGTTTINLSTEAINRTTGDEEGIASLTLFRLNGATVGSNFTGDYTDWTLQSWTKTYNDSTGDMEDTYSQLEDAEVTGALMDGGKWGIILKLGSTDLPPVGDDDIYVYTGETKSITDLTKRVHIMGGTLDATGVSADTPLSDRVIVEGPDGLLLMTGGQTLNLAGNLTGDNAVGYDVEGQNGGSAGTIGIGTAGGRLNSTSVDLTGESYKINTLNVRSGITTIDENTNLGHDDTEITVGTATSGNTTNAILSNNGAITGNTMVVNADGSVTNNKNISLKGGLTLNNGAAMANMEDGSLTATDITVNQNAILLNSGTITGDTAIAGNMTNEGSVTGDIQVTDSGTLTNMEDGSLTATDITVAENATLTNSGTITTTDANISGDVINGGTASADHIQLNGGATLTNLKDATITTTDDIQVSQDAMLTNNGTITGDINLTGTMTNNGNNSGDITVGDGGLLTGGGTFGRVNVQNGGMLNIQGAPSFTGLTFDDNSGISFTVNGITPYSTGLSAQETYSHATVSTLTLNSVPSITVNIGAGLIAAGSVDFTLDLLKTTELLGDAVGSITEETLNEQLKLAGMTNLLEDGSTLTWDEESGTLSFSGTVSLASSTGLARQDAALLADTLWSGVSSVASFARTAAEQGKMAGCRSSRLWGAGLGYFTSMSTAGSLSGFSYKGGGYAVGGDVALNKTTVVGASFGQMFGTHKSDNSMLSDKQRSFMFALYGNHCQEVAQNQTLTLSGYFSYGNIDHSANTHVGGTTPGHADWDDHAYAFGLLANWDIAVSDKLTVSPYTGLTYMYGTQGTIEETFNGGKRYLGNGSLQTWSIPVGVTLKSVCSLSNGQALLPELSIAYVGDIARRNPYTRTWANGQAVTGKGHNPGRNALMTRAGLGWQINKNWQAGAYYTLEVRSGQTNQSVNLNASYSF